MRAVPALREAERPAREALQHRGEDLAALGHVPGDRRPVVLWAAVRDDYRRALVA